MEGDQGTTRDRRCIERDARAQLAALVRAPAIGPSADRDAATMNPPRRHRDERNRQLDGRRRAGRTGVGSESQLAVVVVAPTIGDVREGDGAIVEEAAVHRSERLVAGRGHRLRYGVDRAAAGRADNRIYIPIPWFGTSDTFYTDINTFMSVINNPNVDGPGCDFDTLTIPLIESRCTISLPNMPNYSLGPLVGSECDTLLTFINTPPLHQTMSIYPNPATNYIYISGLQNSFEEIQFIELYNVTGEKIYETNHIVASSSIHLPELPNGVYLLKFTATGDATYFTKLIISK